MKTLLSTNGYEVQVSDEDWDFLQQWSWYVLVCLGKVKQVQRHQKSNIRSMPNEILLRRGLHVKELVDHKDHNPLNNQFENLRPATSSQNSGNRVTPKHNSSGYKGVHYCKSAKGYLSRIMNCGCRVFLGKFTTPEEAAKAYDRAAKRLFGEFAVLNFPEGNP